MMDDLELLRHYATNGVEEAFRTVLERHVHLVYSAALRQVRGAHLAEEVTQAVFLVLARRAGSLRSGTVLSGWLFRTTRFVAARALRNEQLRHRREQEAAQMETCPSSPAADASWDEIAPVLDEALAQLGETDRHAILLRYFEEKALKEVGGMLGSSEEGARKRVSRALEKLRVFLVRRGVAMSTAALASVLAENAVQAAPAGLSASTLAAVTAGAGPTTLLLLVKAAMKSMFYAKVLAGGIPAVALLAVVGAGTLLAQKDDKGKTIEIPGLPAGAKKLEFALVPGRGSVKPFLLGKYEVTQGQYQAVMGTNPSTFKYGPDYPVEQTSWQDTQDFCARLKTILPGELRAKYNFRLPTDEEWSIAVGLPEEKGRTPEEKSRKITGVYPWGTEWPPPKNAGNYADSAAQKANGDPLIPGAYDGFADTAPVGSYPPNQFGLYDMGGNVWEWCEDWIDDEMNIRVVRGAAHFTTSESGITSSIRGRATTVLRNYASGFRVKLEVASP